MDLMRKYLALGIQMNEGEKKIKSKISKADEATLKDSYRDGVWKQAKPNILGGGRFSPIY